MERVTHLHGTFEQSLYRLGDENAPLKLNAKVISAASALEPRPDELICNYNADGLWRLDQPGGWSQLHPVAPQQIVAVDMDNDGLDELAATFTGGGLYTYDLKNAPENRWTPIHPLVPNAMIKFNNGLAAHWGSGGLYTWTKAGGWQQLHPLVPARMWTVDIDDDPSDELVLDYSPDMVFTPMIPLTVGIRFTPSFPMP